MVVRIRLAREGGNRGEPSQGRAAFAVLAALLQPAAVMAGVLAFWRFGADLQWTSEFAISNGFLSHWQVWAAIFAGLEFLAIGLNRTGRKSTSIEVEASDSSATVPSPLAKSGL